MTQRQVTDGGKDPLEQFLLALTTSRLDRVVHMRVETGVKKVDDEMNLTLRETHFSYLLNQNIKKKITRSSTLSPNFFYMSFVILTHAHFILLDVCCYFFSLVLLHFRTQTRANFDFTHYREES